MTIYGCDTSHWKWGPGIDFARMKASGRCDYLLAKASEGVGYADPSYSGWRGIKAIDVLFGSFHFARPGDPVAQADYYLTVAKPVAGELVCLDLEDLAIPDAGNFGAAFCQRVQAKTGTWPLLYTYPDYIRRNDLGPIARLGCPLWFADYSDPLNSIAPWSAYAIRQFTSTGTVPGLPATNVDLNSSPLTLDQLRGLAIGGSQEDDMLPEQWNYIEKGISVTNSGVGSLLNAMNDPKIGALPQLSRIAATLAAGKVDPQAVADALLPGIVAVLQGKDGLTKADVEDAIRDVFGPVVNPPKS